MHVFEIQHLDYDEIDAMSNGSTSSNSSGCVETAFKKLQKKWTGFSIWRIENMNVIALPKSAYGTFFDTESYIVYASSVPNNPATINTVFREVKVPTEIHIHFWLGAATSADKSGVAAYKAVELDSYLGGNAVQHRETQGNESARFRSYFKNSCIRILIGPSLEKGTFLRNVPRMFQIKGHHIPILVQVPSISWAHFTSADVFLIQTESTVFVWLGKSACPIEKLNSTKIAIQVKVETEIGKIVFIEDGYEQTLVNEEKQELQKFLPLDKRHVMPFVDGSGELKESFVQKPILKLYKCSDNRGKYRVAEIKTGPLTQSDLNSESVFIIDNGSRGIWVWVGKRASDKERVEAMRNARGFVKKKRYANNTNVSRTVEGCEPFEFKNLFQFWKDDVNNGGGGGKSNAVAVGKRAIIKFDALTMEERPSLAAETQLIDDGSGQTKVYRVFGNELKEIPKEKHGQFFSRHCYIVWYNYTSVVNKNLVFYWLGLNASAEDVRSAENKALEIDVQLNGTGVHFRVTQGREPAQLLQIFKGKLVIYTMINDENGINGGKIKHASNYLLQVEGSSSFTTKALQVPFKGSSLNSNFCFVLKKNRYYYVWCGNASTGDQREMAKHFTGKDFEIILEGKEPQEFWDLLGGKCLYPMAKEPISFEYRRPASLFHCERNGQFKVDEINNFSQADLIPEDLLLLDAGETVFLWIGKLMSKINTRECENLALQYLESDPSGRDPHASVAVLRQEYEPPIFTGLFPSWNSSFWKDYKCFEDLRHSLQGGASIKTKVKNGYAGKSEGAFDKYDKYPVSVLKGPADNLPSKVDQFAKELHLTHDDFVRLFGMHYREFEGLPRWKQQGLKKTVGLF